MCVGVYVLTRSCAQVTKKKMVGHCSVKEQRKRNKNKIEKKAVKKKRAGERKEAGRSCEASQPNRGSCRRRKQRLYIKKKKKRHTRAACGGEKTGDKKGCLKHVRNELHRKRVKRRWHDLTNTQTLIVLLCDRRFPAPSIYICVCVFVNLCRRNEQ